MADETIFVKQKFGMRHSVRAIVVPNISLLSLLCGREIRPFFLSKV